MFSSTLSARYDAHTTDRTWVCVFCKNGPHCSVGGGGASGDLFGPYLLTPPDKLDVNADGSADERDITEEQKRSGGRNKRSLRGAQMVEQFCQKMSRKVTCRMHITLLTFIALHTSPTCLFALNMWQYEKTGSHFLYISAVFTRIFRSPYEKETVILPCMRGSQAECFIGERAV